MTFDWAAAIKARPNGDTASLTRAFGNPRGGGARPDPNRPGWFTPDPAWEREHLVLVPIQDLPGFPLFNGEAVRGVRVHRLVAPVLVATWAEVHERGLARRLRSFGGAFCPRHMLHDARRPLSVHAFGAAVDFDVPWNGYGIPAERMQINRDVVRVFQECGWEWGGLWSPTDGMHFQWTNPLPGVRQPAWRDAMAKPREVPTVARASGPQVLLRDMSGHLVELNAKRATYGGVVITRQADGSVILERP